MPGEDPFLDLARYYDPIMQHVDYQRWYLIATRLAHMFPRSFRHLDAGCGTGTLIGMLRQAGWNSVGIDLSFAMLHTGRKRRGALPLAVADLRALPFHESIDCITCLFDSLNFLLEESDVCRALAGFSTALSAGGLLYFDVVTERMVTDHFQGQRWTEDNGRFKSTWSSSYDRKAMICDTRVRVNRGEDSLIRERIYPQKFIEKAIRGAGLALLATYDANTGQSPTRRTTRIDFIAAKSDSRQWHRQFKQVLAEIRKVVY